MANFYLQYPPSSISGSVAGVSSVNTFTGAVNIVAGPGIVVTNGGNTVTITATAVSGPVISTPAYGTIVAQSGDSDINFTTGTGATTVNLDIAAPIGTLVIVSDFDAIASTSNITIDAGVGNTINAQTIAQTLVMNINGESITMKKITATAWKVQ